jgi:hypothetical protein
MVDAVLASLAGASPPPRSSLASPVKGGNSKVQTQSECGLDAHTRIVKNVVQQVPTGAGTKRGKQGVFASFCSLSHWSPLVEKVDYERTYRGGLQLFLV